jgi:hypothetical protein
MHPRQQPESSTQFTSTGACDAFIAIPDPVGIGMNGRGPFVERMLFVSLLCGTSNAYW